MWCWSANRNNNFLNKIVWTDESHFTSCGIFNRKNEHVVNWNSKNKSWIPATSGFSLNVWCGILADRFLSAYIFEENLRHNLYLHFWETEFQNDMNKILLGIYRICGSRKMVHHNTILFNWQWIWTQGQLTHQIGVFLIYLWGVKTFETR